MTTCHHRSCETTSHSNPTRERGAIDRRQMLSCLAGGFGTVGLATLLGESAAIASPAGQVDTGFDGDDHAGLKDVRRVLPHRRGLVNLQADAVSQAVREVFAIASIGDKRPGGGVHVLARDAGAHGGNGPGLCLKNDGIYLFEFGFNPPRFRRSAA